MKPSRIFIALALFATLGVSLFAGILWRAVHVERADESAAYAEFAAIRDSLGFTEAMVSRDDSGEWVRRSGDAAGETISTLRVVIYRKPEGRLVRGDAPFWFVKLKGPATQMLLRQLGLDMADYNLEMKDIEAHGPGLILDESRANGDRLLVWLD